MAAKQGLTAQLSQASEDAKRAVLSRTTGLTGWLPTAVVNSATYGGMGSYSNNHNTVCTIKSAPPRSPDVLNVLATKSGWLYKRNEQHVWQARWCCVVPHMFLYYFDADAAIVMENDVGGGGGGGGSSSEGNHHQASYFMSGGDDPNNNTPPILIPPPPSASQQEEWNQAVLKGYGDRKKPRHEKRGFHFGFNNNTTSTTTTTTSSTSNANAATSGSSSNHALTPLAEEPLAWPQTTTSSTAAAAAATATADGSFPPDFDLPSSSYPHPPPHPHGSNNNNNSQHFWPQPAGIIDLECYTTVARSADNDRVWELCGDDSVNPDLRTFYFLGPPECEQQEDWIQSLTQNRHASLLDECEAYKQVCDGFAQQLQMLHQHTDELQLQQEQAQQELYRVRSHQEELRRASWRLVEEQVVLASAASSNNNNNKNRDSENGNNTNNNNNAGVPVSMQTALAELTQHLERLRTQDMSITQLVQVVLEYTNKLEKVAVEEYSSRQRVEQDLHQTGKSDQQKVTELQEQLSALQSKYDTAETEWKLSLERQTALYQQTQKELQDVQKELSSQKLEMTMHGSQQRNKLQELTQHKKILKKEVLDLRQKVDGLTSELKSAQHETQSQSMLAAQEKQKAALLERYVEKVESQVQVQQNMMEFMSANGSVYGGGGGSVYGGGGGSVNGDYNDRREVNAASAGRGGGVYHHSDAFDDEDDDDDEAGLNHHSHHHHPDDLEDEEMLPPIRAVPADRSPRRRGPPRRFVEETDNKSHVSELTEDRTQRHLEGYLPPSGDVSPYVMPRSGVGRNNMSRYYPHHSRSRPYLQRQRQQPPQQRPPGPPSYIIGVQHNDDDDGDSDDLEEELQQRRRPPARRPSKNLDTIQSSAQSLPPGVSTPPYSRSRSIGGGLPRSSGRDSASVSSEPRKLSVAQRARLEADRKTTPVRARLDEKTRAEVEMKASPTPSTRQRQQQSPSSHARSQSPGLWRRMEEAVLGPRTDSDEEDDSSSQENESQPSTRVTDYTDVSATVGEEKKSDAGSSMANLSLADRSRLQRAKQLRFLKEQGLIRDEEDVKGGAGAETASVASSSLTSPSSKPSPRLSL